ncbi:MAG: hypothetical protein JOZ38_11545 [Candidatus Eremiobacteraeota bacterium]|nr:hypothetical protein [Candidatus Eremiobacteraeota bacterium]
MRSLTLARRAVANYVALRSPSPDTVFLVELVTGELLALESRRSGGAIVLEMRWDDADVVLNVWDAHESGEQMAKRMHLLSVLGRNVRISSSKRGKHLSVRFPIAALEDQAENRRAWQAAATLVREAAEALVD